MGPCNNRSINHSTTFQNSIIPQALTVTNTTVNANTQFKVLGKFNPVDPINSILNDCLDDVEQSLEKMADKLHDAALDVIVQAGREVANIIVDLQVAYADSLQKTYDALDKTMRINIDRVRELVKDIVSENMPALEKLADRVADIVKFSPLSNYWLPLLDRISPQYFAVDGTNPTLVTLTFSGNFYYAATKGYETSFEFNGTKYTPVANTTNQLKFRIQVPPSDNSTLHKCSYVSGTLFVPWKNGYLWGTTTSQYKCLLGKLPASPGKITAYITKAASVITQQYASPEITVVRNKSHWETDPYSFKPAPGWHVKQATSSLIWQPGKEGDINDKFVSDSNDTVTYEVSRKEGHGKFHVYFTAEQKVSEETRIDVKDDLRWGSDWLIETGPTEKIDKIVFDVFTGVSVIYQPETDEHSPYIALRRFEDGRIRVRAKNPNEINDPDSTFNLIKNEAFKNLFRRTGNIKLLDDNNNNQKNSKQER